MRPRRPRTPAAPVRPADGGAGGGEMVETDVIHGHTYGVSFAALEVVRAGGRAPALDLTVAGAVALCEAAEAWQYGPSALPRPLCVLMR